MVYAHIAGPTAATAGASDTKCLKVLDAIMADVHPLSGLDIYADTCIGTGASDAAGMATSHPPLPGACAATAARVWKRFAGLPMWHHEVWR